MGRPGTKPAILLTCARLRDFGEYPTTCDGAKIRKKEPFMASLASEKFCTAPQNPTAGTNYFLYVTQQKAST